MVVELVGAVEGDAGDGGEEDVLSSSPKKMERHWEANWELIWNFGVRDFKFGNEGGIGFFPGR